MHRLKELLQQVEAANQRYGLLQKNDALVAGVSGGPDSVALLYLLVKLKKKYNLKICVAHLNHGLLKNESRKYQSLVKKMADGFDIPFYCKAIDLRTLSKKNKRSIEEMGRIERYHFFEEVAAKTRSNKIVTAHTLDDQAETVLLRFLRGSGLKGLAGIPYKRIQGKLEVVRPVLSIEKKKLLSFLKANRIPYLNDRTNADTFFTRNRIRHHLLPALEKSYNPQIKNSLSSLGSICENIQLYLDKISSRATKTCLKKQKRYGSLVLDLKKLNRLDSAIKREVLFKTLSELQGDSKRFSFDHISAVIELTNSSKNNLERHLPNSIIAIKKERELELRFKRR